MSSEPCWPPTVRAARSKVLPEPDAHVHFVGIGGAGLSAIARVLMEMGYRVSGSDRAASALTAALVDEGATVYVGHRAEQVSAADLVVVSSAVPADNVELMAARAQGIPAVKRADFLGQMMAGRLGVAVAGTHGKTTTSGMMATVLLFAGQDPTFIVGGQIAHLGTNARAGRGPFVIEADEYDHTFLGLRPTLAVVTNVEHDHPDCYPTWAEFQAAFVAFVELLPPDGVLVVCADDPGARELGELREARGKAVVWYGLAEDADWRAVDVQLNRAGGCDYVALAAGPSGGPHEQRQGGARGGLRQRPGDPHERRQGGARGGLRQRPGGPHERRQGGARGGLRQRPGGPHEQRQGGARGGLRQRPGGGLVRLCVPGIHNVVNSLAVLAVADQLGVPFVTVAQALRAFRGIGRRFEIKGVARGVTVVDDYAHHPTEIRATLAAARGHYPDHRIWAVWQPHTYSRTKTLLDDFSTAFGAADHVLVTPIYAARETHNLGISSADVVARMDHADVRVVADLDQAVAVLQAGVQPDDVVLTLGAGDGYQVGERLLTLLDQARS